MLRVRVEIIPWGQHSKTEVMYEAYVANDGTGMGLGANGGGRGNYDISLSDMAHRWSLPGYLGRLENLERTPWHRITMARTALQRLETAVQKLIERGDTVGWQAFGDETNKDVIPALEAAVREDLGGAPGDDAPAT